MVGPEKKFQNGGSHMAGKRYFEIGFCKYVISLEGNVTNLLRRIYRKYIRHSFVSRVYYGPTMVEQGEKFSKLRFSAAWKMLFYD